MKKMFFLRESFYVYKYFLIFDERRAFNFINELDKYYGMGEKYTDIATVENFDRFYKFASGSNKTIKVVNKKRRKRIKYKDVYEYTFYIFSRTELSSLIFSIFNLNSNSKLELSYALNCLFNYKPQNDDEKQFLLKFLSIIKFENCFTNDTDYRSFDDTTFAFIPKISKVKEFCSKLVSDSNSLTCRRIYKKISKLT